MPFGWTRTGSMIVLAYGGGVIVAAALYFLAQGGGIETGRAIIRATAWSSIIAFLVTYSARPLHQLLRTGVTRAMLINRRYWGVSFFVSHLLHAVAIAYVFELEYDGDWTRHAPLWGLVLGGLCYVLLGLMAITSTSGWVRRLGPKNWKALHWTGMQYAYVIFARNYVLSMFALPHDGYWRTYIFGPLLIAALGIRVYVWWTSRQTRLA